MHVDESASGSTVDLGLGQTLEIRLPENPTTGFRWQIEADGSPSCVLTRDSYEAVGSRPGSGGTRGPLYRAVSSGTCHIAIAYQRAGEAAASATRTFTLRVQVADK